MAKSTAFNERKSEFDLTKAYENDYQISRAASTKASTAMVQVFNTPELLDLILSHLPASGLFAMAKVNRHHRAGVYTSISARRTLFLIPRPALLGSWWLARHRAKELVWAYRHSIVLNAEVLQTQWNIEPIIPAEICPLLSRLSPPSRLHLESDRHPQDPYLGHGESARFAFQPENAVLLPGMMLTNPPCHDVFIRLVYVHSSQSHIKLAAERVVHNSHKHSCGLTLSAVLEEAYGLLGDVVFYEQKFETGGEVRRERTNLRKEIANEREERGGYFRICFKRTRLRFRDMTIAQWVLRLNSEQTECNSSRLFLFDEKGFEEWTDVLTFHKRAINVQVCFGRSWVREEGASDRARLLHFGWLPKPSAGFHLPTSPYSYSLALLPHSRLFSNTQTWGRSQEYSHTSLPERRQPPQWRKRTAKSWSPPRRSPREPPPIAEHATEQGTAMARVLNTPELFDLVLSRLTGRDLFTAAAVNKEFRAAVRSSHRAKETLFPCARPILPGKWCMLRRTRIPGNLGDITGPPPPPVYTSSHNHSQIPSRVSLATRSVKSTTLSSCACGWLPFLCSPPIDRFDGFQDSWHSGMRQAGPLVCTQLWKEPIEGTMLADMLLTSPPYYSVFIHLEYKQKDGTNLCADRRIRENSALTMGSLLHAARKMHSRVLGERLVDSVGHRRRREVCQFENTSLDTELAKRHLRGERFKMDCLAAYMRFDSKRVVTAKVWKELQRKQMMSDAADL